MPRWGSKKTNPQTKAKQSKLISSSGSSEPKTSPSNSPENNKPPRAPKSPLEDGSKPDPAAVAMAANLLTTDTQAGLKNPLKLNRVITDDSDADLEKGRYVIGSGEESSEPVNKQQFSKELNSSQDTEPSSKLKAFWKGVKSDVSVASGNVNDKYRLFNDNGNRVRSMEDDRSKMSRSRGAEQPYEEGTISTFGSFIENASRRMGMSHKREHRDEDDDTWRSFTYSMDGVSYTGDFETLEVKQRYGYCAIGLSIIQLFTIAVMMALCGVAPIKVNPMVGPYPDTFSYWGGKNAWLITQQFEIWRVATPIFLHAGIIHLFCNVAIQLETGAFFEREWGSGTWFLIYILSAIGSSVVSCITQPDTISVGASGALMGLFGAKLGEVFMFSCFCVERIGGKATHGVKMEQLSGVLCSVAILSLFSIIPFVDWASLLGGLFVGFLVGICIFSWNIDGIFIKCLWGTFALLGLIGGLAYAIFYMYTEMEFNPDLQDACQFFRRDYVEGYECTCQYTFGTTDDAYGDDDDWAN